MSGTDKEGGGVAEAVLMRKRLYKFLIGFVVSVAVSIMLLIALIWSVGNKVLIQEEDLSIEIEIHKINRRQGVNYWSVVTNSLLCESMVSDHISGLFLVSC